MEIYVYIVFLTVFSEVAAHNPFAGCMKENTYGYGYLQYFPVEVLPKEWADGGGPQDPKARFYIEFHVRASQNAHILICENDQDKSGLEILLGGGANTFSQIRRLTYGSRNSLKTVRMANTVSDAEDRGFWIELDSLNNLLVGVKGNGDPFLYYHSTFPFPIRFFSFATWTNVKGVWHFACPKNPPPGEDREERNATTTERLRNDLFTYYNPYNFPESDENPSQTIQVHLEANGLHLEEIRGEFEISGIASLKWSDRKLTWDPQDYDSIDSIHVKPSFLWTPHIKVLNSATFEKTSFLTATGSVLVKNTGEVIWRSPFHSTTFCLTGYKKWPYDGHNCSLTVGFSGEPLKISIDTMVISTTLMSHWEIHAPGENMTASGVGEVTVQFHFQRRNPSEIIRNFVAPPFLSAATLTLLSFWSDPSGVVRLFLCCGGVFILITTIIVLGGTLPNVLSAETAGFYHLCVFVYVFPVLFFVGLKYLPDGINLPKSAVNFLNNRINRTVFCLPETRETPGKFSSREETERSNNAFLVGVLYERFIFFIYLICFVVSFVIALIFLEIVL